MPGMTKEKFTEYIKKFDFQNLFIDLGWDHESASGSLISGEQSFGYKIVAKLQGFFVIVISSAEQYIPASSLRKQISTKLSQTYPENLLIFHGTETQYWSYRVQVDSGKERYTETAFSIDKEADALFQRASGLFFRLDEYDKITFVDVKSKVRKGFSVNYDAVTKKFYDHFKKEHESFKKAIEGIVEDTDLDWYTSVTLNRLMFCYFIQKKGFLDNDTNYLQNKLKLYMDEADDTGFYSFYLKFLTVLFHNGLGGRERDEKKKDLLGNIPYLNGGMFEVHELEQKYDGIKINNNAFKEIFDFFDRYKWHLDINPDAPGNEINPDVLGYIFEKYINQRAEMGAYYTKEDITGYIGKNTILPFLFDEVKRKYPDPFKENGEIWKFLRDSGDEYIYPSMKHGIPEQALKNTDSEGLFDDLPDEIRTGLNPEQKDLWKIRKPWNKPAPAEIALPTEIYREVIERRNRYKDVKNVIVSGNIKEINDLITYNLDIINFTEDLLTNTEDPKLVEHFYKAIEKVTILDPTCGSGAFLFAAMNILEPLYEILIERMRSFVYDEDRINAQNYEKRKGFLFKYSFFREIIGKVLGLKNPDDLDSGQKHPNQKYFILKSIILNNLYGVDIMREAVEIAKLRLFLKLVAQVHPNPREKNLGIEPLPDMDFNLKTGNTLVGFRTKGDIMALDSMWTDDVYKLKIFNECDVISHVFERFKEEQLSGGETTLLKLEMKARIQQLNNQLNLLLQRSILGHEVDNGWARSHSPFHWFAEFYGIFENSGGFDIIIGNPPYVVYKEDGFTYTITGYQTKTCGNLYAYIIESVQHLQNPFGAIAMIVPLSLTSGVKFKPVRDLLQSSKKMIYYSHFDTRPAELFENVDQRLTIFISNYSSSAKALSSSFYRWNEAQRKFLFENIVYSNAIQSNIGVSKYANSGFDILYNSTLNYRKIKDISGSVFNNYFVYRSAGGRYYLTFFDDFQKTYINKQLLKVTAEKSVNVDDNISNFALVATLSSTLFYHYYLAFSDCRNLTKELIQDFPLLISPTTEQDLDLLGKKLMSEYNANAVEKTMIKKNGDQITYWEINARKSKSIMDSIDEIIARFLSLSDEMIDYIIHFDIKFRIDELQEGND